MTKYKLAPKSCLIPLTTSSFQLLKTLIKKYSYKCKIQELPGIFLKPKNEEKVN